MNKTQTRRMIKMMEEQKRQLRGDVPHELPELTVPLQKLFDDCISFISLTDLNL